MQRQLEEQEENVQLAEEDEQLEVFPILNI